LSEGRSKLPRSIVMRCGEDRPGDRGATFESENALPAASVGAMNATIEGGCLCRGVRYRLGEVPGDRNDCHCIDCRRSSGAPYVTWGTVSRTKLQLLAGELRTIRHADRVRSWAACCGTHLFFADRPESASIDVTIASLDDPAPYPPEMSIWTEDRLPWVALDERRPAYRKSRRHG
jgi:hypothetical protein